MLKSIDLSSKWKFKAVLVLFMVSFVLQSFASLAMAALPGARSAQVNGEVFLAGNYIELGISSVGSIGTVGSAPAGFHPGVGERRLGMVADGDGFDTGKLPETGDFFLPGFPFEGYTLGYRNGASNSAIFTTVSALTYGAGSLAGSTSVDLSSGSTLKAQTKGTIDGKIEYTQTVSFDVNDKFYRIDITAKNLTTSKLFDVRYMRSVDPDQDLGTKGTYVTKNMVLSNPTADAAATVYAKGYFTDEPIVYYSKHANSRASLGMVNLYQDLGYNEDGSKMKTASEVNSDDWINMAFKLGDLNPAGSKTVTMYVSLNPDFTKSLDDLNSTTPTNSAPTLSTVNTLNSGIQDQSLKIQYADLLAASDLADSDTADKLSFLIESVTGGTLTDSLGAPVAAGTTMLSAGDFLTWTPDAGTNGILNAFKVKGFDGTDASSTEVQVKVLVSPLHQITFDANGTQGISLPSDTNTYYYGNKMVLPAPGCLCKPGHVFSGWTEDAAGLKTLYPAGSTYTFGLTTPTFFAQTKLADLKVIYNGNGHTSGRAPVDSKVYRIGDTAPVADQSILKKTGFTFTGWNTKADGTGLTYYPGSSLKLFDKTVELFAQWSAGNTIKIYVAKSKFLATEAFAHYRLAGSTAWTASPGLKLSNSEHKDFWTADIPLGTSSSIAELALTDGKGIWENNGATGKNYVLTDRVSTFTFSKWTKGTPEVLDITAPSTPLYLNGKWLSNPSSYKLEWQPATDNQRVVAYEVYRNGVLVAVTDQPTYTDCLADGTKAEYQVLAVDQAGNKSGLSNSWFTKGLSTITVFVQKSGVFKSSSTLHYRLNGSPKWTAYPGAPMSVSATYPKYWSIDVDVTGPTLVAEAAISDNGTTWFNNGGKNYTLTERYYTFENGVLKTGTPADNDLTAPDAPALINGTSNETPAGLTITWNASDDNIGVTGYEVYRDGVLITTTSALTYTDNLPVGTKATYQIIAVDAKGNKSAPVSWTGTVAGPYDLKIFVPKNGTFEKSAFIHYRLEGSSAWTSYPGVKLVNSSIEGYWEVEIPLKGASGIAEAAFTDNGSKWVNNGGKNYKFGKGVYSFVEGITLNGGPDASNPQTVNVYYYMPTGAKAPQFHYRNGTGNWSVEPGFTMSATEQTGWYKHTVTISSVKGAYLAAAFYNVNTKSFDNNGSKDYRFVPGNWTVKNGVVTQGLPE